MFEVREEGRGVIGEGKLSSLPYISHLVDPERNSLKTQMCFVCESVHTRKNFKALKLFCAPDQKKKDGDNK